MLLILVYIELFYKFVLLYDVGKVGIFDLVLFKLGKLIDEEFIVMKEYLCIGV